MSLLPEARSTRFGIERFIPAQGTAQDVAHAICASPDFLAAVQRGIDAHDAHSPETDDKTDGMGFQQAIAWELIGVPGQLERNTD